MGFVRLVIFGFIGLTIVYFLVSIYSRSVRREKLEKEWAEDHPGNANLAERDAFVAEGMMAYENGLRRKLILGVYIIPVTIVALIIYFTNFY